MIEAISRRITLLCILAAACWLSLLTVINGYPLVFPDTGTYIRQAVKLEGVLDRPPYYSIFLLPLHLRLTLWAIPFAQNLLVSCVLFRWMGLVFERLTPPRALVVMLLTGALTYLPWCSNEIMPDVFTPLIVLVVFLVTQMHERLRLWEQAAWALLLTMMLAFHQANPLFALGLLVVMLASGWWQRRRGIWFARSALLVVGPVVLAITAQTLYGYLVIGRFTPSPAAPYFLLTRIIVDGPGREYLAKACPERHYFLCDHQSELNADADELLWDARSPLAAMRQALGPYRALDEASAITRAALLKHGGEELGYAMRNAAIQFISFGTTGDPCPCLIGKVDRMMRELFPQEYEQYATSRQNLGLWPYQTISRLHVAVVVLAGLALLARVALRRAPLGGNQGAFLVLLGFSLVLNATLMGALSEPTERYQARIIWLVPLTCFAMAMAGTLLPRQPTDGRSSEQKTVNGIATGC